jgi:predicted aldo/keto reductase-like oxidoreductase
LDYAIDHDLADVVLAAYSFGTDPTLLDKLRHTFHWAAIQPDIPHVLAKARTKDIGVIAMKTLMGGRLNDMRPYEKTGGTFSQAALRWTLSQSNVDALIISMTSQTLIDEYLGASGYMRVSTDDYELLERYAEMQLRSYCQPACNACETSCPSQVDIAEVLRSRMYDVDYRDPALARYEYSQLGSNASACLTCVSQACLNACPRGVPIAAFTRQAASQLG